MKVRFSMLLLSVFMFLSCLKEDGTMDTSNSKQLTLKRVPVAEQEFKKQPIQKALKINEKYQVLLNKFNSKRINFKELRDSLKQILLSLRDIKKVKYFGEINNYNQSFSAKNAQLSARLGSSNSCTGDWSFVPGVCPYSPEEDDLCSDYFYYTCNEHCDNTYNYILDCLWVVEQGLEGTHQSALDECAMLTEAEKAVCIANAEQAYFDEWNTILATGQAAMLEYIACGYSCSSYGNN